MSTSETATQQVPGLTRTDLQQQDLSALGREVVQNRADIAPEAPPIKHKHPGEQIIYVLEGSLEYDDVLGREAQAPARAGRVNDG